MNTGRLLTLVATILVGSSCRQSNHTDRQPPPDPPRTEVAGSRVPVLDDSAQPNSLERARQAIDASLASAGLPGAPELKRKRSDLLSRAKGEPAVFVRAPEYQPTESPTVRDLRRGLSTAHSHAWQVVEGVLKMLRGRHELARATILRDGYLYSADVNLAFAFISMVGPEHLFNEEQIWVERGENHWRARRFGRPYPHYVYLDGPHQGARVRLLHFDRFGADEPSPPPLHRDFRALKYRLHFDAARVRHITETNIVADLRYGSIWVPTLLESRGAQLELAHELVPPEDATEVADARELNRRQQYTLQSLRQAILAQVNEELPFDEPKTEIDQQDGKLRGEWRKAYRLGKSRYEFNHDEYQIFGSAGQALVPQVCLDFLLDTLERASGNWWRPRGETPGRTPGKFAFDPFAREQLRGGNNFLKFAREHDDWFEVYRLPARDKIEMGDKPEFFRYLSSHPELYQPGDMVFIRGLTPWDQVELHTHSFFIFESDPLTTVPILVAGNAGPANLWSWETEARRTPNRTIFQRVRPRLDWLEQIVVPVAPDVAETAPVLVK